MQIVDIKIKQLQFKYIETTGNVSVKSEDTLE